MNLIRAHFVDNLFKPFLKPPGSKVVEENVVCDQFIKDFDSQCHSRQLGPTDTKCLAKKVSKIMDISLPFVEPNAPLESVLKLFSNGNKVLFVEKNKYPYMITVEKVMDLSVVQNRNLLLTTIEGVELQKPARIDSKTSILNAIKVMREKDVPALIVTEGDFLASGYVTLEMLYKYLADHFRDKPIEQKTFAHIFKEIVRSFYYNIILLIVLIIVSTTSNISPLQNFLNPIVIVFLFGVSMLELKYLNHSKLELGLLITLSSVNIGLISLIILYIPIRTIILSVRIVQFTFYFFTALRIGFILYYHKIVVEYARKKVGRNRRRVLLGNYDIDLSYITPRIMAMSFPSEGIESIYRNSIKDIAQYLAKFHNNNYCVYNLCLEKDYNYSFFKKVNLLYRFPDHNVPPLTFIFNFCEDAKSELLNNGRCVVVHCKGGKGRTGLMISCLLLYIDHCEDSKDALYIFAKKRSKKEILKNMSIAKGLSKNDRNNMINKILCEKKVALDLVQSESEDDPLQNVQRVSGRSQLRYVGYFCHSLKHNMSRSVFYPPTRYLKQIHIVNLLKTSNLNGILTLKISIYDIIPNEVPPNPLLQNSMTLSLRTLYEKRILIECSNISHTISLDEPISLQGDFKIHCFSQDGPEIWFMWLNTCFVEKSHTTKKDDIDIVNANQDINDKFLLKLSF